MMCIDSCSLLRDIILYLAENGDFKKRKKDAVLSVVSLCTLHVNSAKDM